MPRFEPASVISRIANRIALILQHPMVGVVVTTVHRFIGVPLQESREDT